MSKGQDRMIAGGRRAGLHSPRHLLFDIAERGRAIEKIRAGTGVHTHQQVFQITRRLRETGRINGEMVGGEWHFWAKP
jgi:hypothetical protein